MLFEQRITAKKATSDSSKLIIDDDEPQYYKEYLAKNESYLRLLSTLTTVLEIHVDVAAYILFKTDFKG